MAVKAFVLMFLISAVSATLRYYGEYIPFGSGLNLLIMLHQHFGPRSPIHKWNVECQDGEAAIGLRDGTYDFERLEILACLFTFSNKPPAQGVYPYYPSCHVRNYTATPFCYDPTRHEQTVDTFVTGMRDDDSVFQRPPSGQVQEMKCCKTPTGYYLDYISCYYMPTHDSFGEYYDSNFHMIVQCGTGFVMTGIANKINPWLDPLVARNLQLEWIQCCRVGFGPKPQMHAPPVIQTPHGAQVFYAQRAYHGESVPKAYENQYAGSMRQGRQELSTAQGGTAFNESVQTSGGWNVRFTKAKPLPQREHFDWFS